MSVTGYWEWVLGEPRSKSLMHVGTEIDPVTGAVFARNYYSPEFLRRSAFVDCSESVRTVTGDRTEFLGRNGSASHPAAMNRLAFRIALGSGMDPCAAIQTQVSLEDDQERSSSSPSAPAPMKTMRDDWCSGFEAKEMLSGAGRRLALLESDAGRCACGNSGSRCEFLANGWLIYQTLACRMWARTGFYQSGGAYGFRDQLQDAMALIHADPDCLREHLLRACSRQFREGDVQHWWHPPAGRGVRTHFSDDFLWLPVALCRYVQMTGDTGVLEERVPFLSPARCMLMRKPTMTCRRSLTISAPSMNMLCERSTTGCDSVFTDCR
jgi:cyclic beta-1,2-glucan synthetase